ncbi:MAG: protein phosphatase 2C domain-containing protein [Thiothrix sp.]
MRKNGDFFWRSASMTDVGARRELNEDSILERKDMGLWVVADGMGGHQCGDEASQLVVSMLAALTLHGTLEDREKQVINTLKGVHGELQRRADEKKAGIIGTTAAVLVLHQQKASCIWVGDSRIYLSRYGDLRQLSTDHTQVNELVRLGLLNAEDAKLHPAGHVLTRAIGGNGILEPEVVRFPVQVGDIFLICSDGLTAMLDESEIATELGRWPTAIACANLMDTALARYAKDNVSVIVISVDDVDEMDMTMINPVLKHI